MDSLRRLMQLLKDDQIDMVQFQQAFAELGSDLELTGTDQAYAAWLDVWLRLAEYTGGHISAERFLDLALDALKVAPRSTEFVFRVDEYGRVASVKQAPIGSVSRGVQFFPATARRDMKQEKMDSAIIQLPRPRARNRHSPVQRLATNGPMSLVANARFVGVIA